MLLAVILSAVLIAATSLMHFGVLSYLSYSMKSWRGSGRFRFLICVWILLAAHLAEIVVYAGAYALAVNLLDIGQFGGLPVNHPYDFVYFSIVSYTSLGLGDVFPGGHLRLITGVEALNGLILIAWSGSFIFACMNQRWFTTE